MFMRFVFIVFLAIFVTIIDAAEVRTLYGPKQKHAEAEFKKTYIFDVNEHTNEFSNHDRHRNKRSTDELQNGNFTTKISHLNDTHMQLMVYFLGEGSNVIICLAGDIKRSIVKSNNTRNSSAVYISYDNGDSYENKTELFKLPNGSYATLEKFYYHPKYKTHFVFTDIQNNYIFVTTNLGRNITQIKLNFTPSNVSFYEPQPLTFIVLDKNDLKQKLWITEDFGMSFRLVQEYVNSLFWIQDDDSNPQIVLHRHEPNNSSMISYSQLNNTEIPNIYATDVIDIYMKGDYLFTTKLSSNGDVELYVSYKLGKRLQCIFDSGLDKKYFYIVDVMGNRALVAVSHTDTLSNLYVSENLAGVTDKVHFTLSLEAVLSYFPNGSWHHSWLRHVADEAFADIYKVEGLSGIYVASQVITKPNGTNLGPHNLASLITFNYGATWRPIKPPTHDNTGQLISCSNCSLHLGQKFSQLYPYTRSSSILSSQSAPGIIVATGVIGKSLKGHHDVYVSTDAGFTWRQSLKDPHFFNMGDHGGILAAAIKKSRGGTRHILYSTDEGEKWKQIEFNQNDIKLYGLLTEPGENTTVFTMFGSAPDIHQWIIVKIELKNVFAYACTKDDYKSWSPSQNGENRNYVPCVLGKQNSYERRMAKVNCYNGLNYNTAVSEQTCDCDALDYECDLGFMRSGTNLWHCVRNKTSTTNPYDIPKACKPGQFYNRTKGYRKISGDVCVAGFEQLFMPDLLPCPNEEIDEFLLFSREEHISRFDLKTETVEDLPIANLTNVIGIDFDMKNNCVYWGTIDTIGRQCLNNGSVSEILVSSDLESIEGMALDWISNTLYFVNSKNAKIEVIRTDISRAGRMRKTILGPDVLKKPRGIALHPTTGYLFCTDWSTDNPSVGRSNLDGSNYLQLFTKPTVEWPNGITIDHIAERIYWVDARRDYIASSDLHGDRMKKIIINNDAVSHPFGVAVFKDTVYWNDWKRKAVFSADKDDGVAIRMLLEKFPLLKDLKVYAHSVQEGTNKCYNSSVCPYICVGAPKQGYKCLCPDSLISTDDKCLCPGGVQPYPNITCPRVDNTCSADHFTCDNGVCLPKGWKCDGEDDCGDNSDEAHCEVVQECGFNFFICGDGKCLPPYYRCDYESDCADGSDELNCTRQNCTAAQFTCRNGRCISNYSKCDGENDCRDGSDEEGCEATGPNTCKSGEFACAAGSVVCIPSTSRCDGNADCPDGADERNCTELQSPTN